MRKLLQGALLLLLAAALALHAQDLSRGSKRLILKDGSYQTATKWEIKGDRVRYWSAERSMWEEVPNSLVDWKATEAWAKDHPKGATAETIQLSAEEEAERRAEEAKTPAIAPGLKLPYEGGVYLFDQLAGEQMLVEMVQNSGEIDPERGKNILRAAINPFAQVKQSIVLKGTRARVQAHAAQPVFYLNVASDDEPEAGSATIKKKDTDQLADRFRISRATKKKDARVVGNLKIALTGRVSQHGNWIAVRQEPVSGGWVKLTPAQPLPPGEYAIVEMLNPKEMNLFVWDFGVDPSAPRNDAAWKPGPLESNETGTKQSPVLDKRPR
jgi:hypothetical protein